MSAKWLKPIGLIPSPLMLGSKENWHITLALIW